MSILDVFNFSATVVMLYWGYICSRGQAEVIRRNRKLPKLIKERVFYEQLHASTNAQLAYLAEAILTVCAIAGAAIMFTAIDGMPPVTPAFSVAIKWIAGGTIYFLSIFKLGCYYRATKRYEKTMIVLSEEISKLESQPAAL